MLAQTCTERISVTNEELLNAVCAAVVSTDASAELRARERLDQLTKPPGSLGKLEGLAARVARIQNTTHPTADYKAIILAAADHGVVAENISPYPQDVTWQMVANFVAGGAAINQLAATVEAELWLVDVGVAHDLSAFEGVLHHKIADGTRNMVAGPAMSREEAARAVMVGVGLARAAAERGVRLLGTGEMGIGNTTAAAALCSAFTGAEPARVVGRGTGLDDAGVARKAEVVSRALVVNDVDSLDPLGVLAAVGGLEIACLAGVVIGGAEQGIAVVADGYISGAAALAATRICPRAADYLLPSHRSSEPGHTVLLESLGLEPILDLDMRLGEGTGAALAFGIIDAACQMISGMATFAEAGVSGEEPV